MSTRNYSTALKIGGLFSIAALMVTSLIGIASADIVVVAIDRKVERVNGKMKTVENPASDSVMVLDLKSVPPKILGEVDAPTTVVGPPITAAIAPDESIAIVAGGMKINPDNPTGKVIPNDKITVIDLRATPPKVVAQLTSGKMAVGVAISPKGDLALVANRGTNTVSVFGISGTTVSRLPDVVVSKRRRPGPSGVAISPDGKTALVTLDKEHGVAILSIDGMHVQRDKRLLTTSLRPYAVAMSPTGTLAAVANMGRGKGDVDSVSLIDMTAKPIRVIETISVGLQPEAITFSPDGKMLAVGLQNGSQYKKDSPFYNDHGRLVIYATAGNTLKKLSEAKIGSWSQGVVFSKDGKHILAQSMMGKSIKIYSLTGGKLTDTGKSIELKGGGAAMRTAY